MNAKDLRMEQVYICSDGQKTAHMYYYGMSEDKYMFIPCHPVKKHFCGSPCKLEEREVSNLIKPLS